MRSTYARSVPSSLRRKYALTSYIVSAFEQLAAPSAMLNRGECNAAFVRSSGIWGKSSGRSEEWARLPGPKDAYRAERGCGLNGVLRLERAARAGGKRDAERRRRACLYRSS